MWDSDDELAMLVAAESDRVERKASLADREEVKKVICAFANDLADHRKAGVVFVGLNPDGTCANLAITEEMERLVASFRSEGGLLPLPALRVQRKHLCGCDLLVIQVEPTAAPPMRLRGVAYVRVGPTTQRATAEEEHRLVERIRWNVLPFDHRPVPGATAADLDLALFQRVYLPNALSPEILSANDRPLEHQLSSLRLATPEGQPTYAGILTLGKDVRQWLPGAYVQFVRFEGARIDDAIRDQKELNGPLLDLMKQLDELVTLNIQTPTEIVGRSTEHRRPDYPSEALRQLARNAVMHRSYEGTNAPVRLYWFADRVETHNPGGPFGQVNRENFGQPGLTDYRNPLLAEAMRVLGYVQRFGYGIPLARKELDKNGNPPPVFQVESTHVVAIVRRQT